MAATDSPLIAAFPNRDYGKFQTEVVDKTKQEEVAQRQRGVALRRQLGENLAAIEKEHLEKVKQFTTDSSKAVVDYDSRVQDEEAKLKAKQGEQHSAFLEKQRVETDPKAPHGSQEYFRLRKIEEMLFQQKRYPEAQQHKERAEALAKTEHAEWEENRNKRIKLHEERFLQEQQQAAASHRQRSETARLELLSKQNVEKEKIHRLYEVKKAHVEEQHNFEMRKHAIYPGSTLNLANSLVLNKKSGNAASGDSRVWSVP